MSETPFRPNAWPTLGVEIELQLVDAQTMALRNAIADLLERLPAGLDDAVKPEFMQSYVEVNTDVCGTVSDVEADLTAKVRAVERAAALCGLRLFWAGTHPFSRWRDQRITPGARYAWIAEQLQETVVRPVTFGLHVHVGVESGDLAIRITRELQRYLPVLLALSANSPLWQGRATGHQAHRIELLEALPTGGLPPEMSTWDDYQTIVRQLQAAGFIDSARELWWDARPNPGNGTVEVRVCDMPQDLSDLLGLTALIQCLVHDLSRQIKQGLEPTPYPPLMVRQNRWRAYRYGLEAILVDPVTLERLSARAEVDRLAWRLRGTAMRLGALRHLEHVHQMVARGTGADRQLALFRESGDPAAVVRHLSTCSRLSPNGGLRETYGAAALPLLPSLVGSLTRSSLSIG